MIFYFYLYCKHPKHNFIITKTNVCYLLKYFFEIKYMVHIHNMNCGIFGVYYYDVLYRNYTSV